MNKHKPVRRKAKTRKKSKNRGSGFVNVEMVGLIVGIVVLVAVIALVVSGCGVSHGSARKVVRSLIEGYAKGNDKQVRECYGQKKNPEESLVALINSSNAYIDAHNARSLKAQDIDVLTQEGDIYIVYARYDLVLDQDQSYPCVGTYAVKREGRRYYIMPPSQITQEVSNLAASAYAKLMTTDKYKEYTREYNTFVKKNPGYEDKIAGKLTY